MSSTAGDGDPNDGSGTYSDSGANVQGGDKPIGSRQSESPPCQETANHTDREEEEEQQLDDMGDDCTGRTRRPYRQHRPPAWMRTGNYVM